jgi:hypothetical protein
VRECGFDGRDVVDDAAELAAVCGRLAALVDERQDASERPEPEIFSATEYVQHSVEVIEGILGYIAAVIGIQAPQVGDLGTAVGVAQAILPSITADQRAALLHDKYGFRRRWTGCCNISCTICSTTYSTFGAGMRASR